MSSSRSSSRRPSVESLPSRSSSAGHDSRKLSGWRTTSSRSSASGVSQDGSANFRRSRQVFQALAKILQDDSHYLDALKGSILKSMKAHCSLKKPTACICLALGAVNQWQDAMHVRYSTVGLAQLIVLITLLDAFGIDRRRTTISDPSFQEEDLSFLRSLSFNASDDAFGTEASPNLPVLKEATLVYHPGCSIAQIYKRNWSPEGLSKIITLQGTDSILHQAVGKYVNFRINGQRATITASTSQNGSPHFMSAIEEAVSDAHEPSRRTMSVSQEMPLPNVRDYVRGDIKANKTAAHLGAIDLETIQYAVGQAHTLCWASESLLKRMPPAFWRLPSMVTKVSGSINVDLAGDKSSPTARFATF